MVVVHLPIPKNFVKMAPHISHSVRDGSEFLPSSEYRYLRFVRTLRSLKSGWPSVVFSEPLEHLVDKLVGQILIASETCLPKACRQLVFAFPWTSRRQLSLSTSFPHPLLSASDRPESLSTTYFCIFFLKKNYYHKACRHLAGHKDCRLLAFAFSCRQIAGKRARRQVALLLRCAVCLQSNIILLASCSWEKLVPNLLWLSLSMSYWEKRLLTICFWLH